tara:strand:- start:952 stop:1305 length:354 start_codon:yes stop_codon:yes gene_type:complete
MSSSNIYTAGLYNVGSYQVAGIPYLTASNVSSETQFTFPSVTKKITVENTGSADVNLYFSASSVNKLILPASKTISMDVKCTFIYVSASSATGIQMVAELTNIDPNRMYSLAGLEGV